MSKRRSTAAEEPRDNVVPYAIHPDQLASDATAAPGRYVHELPLEQLRESPLNPRQRFDERGLEELAASIREKGVITPVLVRPVFNGDAYELAAGHRRRRAALMAGRSSVPAVIREMGDTEFLEVLVTENDQREDVHPLEEASGYKALIKGAGYDVAKIAARVGRSVKYVYDRIKLLDLIPVAQKLFLEDRFTAGHAILLARLDAKLQKKAIDPDEDGPSRYHTTGLWQAERGFDWQEGDDEKQRKDPYFHLKPVSVRELEAWINHNVKAEAAAVDPILFPETAEYLNAQPAHAKVVPIMRLDQTPNAARGAERIYTDRSWKRADGVEGSKTCNHGEPGMVAIGPGRYEAFTICRKKERCRVHWLAEIRAREASAKESAKAKASGKDPQKAARDRYALEEKRRQEQEEAREREWARWEKARPAILEAMAAAVLKAPTKANGLLASIVVRECGANYRNVSGAVEKFVPLGRTAEDVLRHAAMMAIEKQLHRWEAPRQFHKVAQAFGIDVKKVIDKAVPVEKPPAAQTSAKGGKPVRGTCRKCGCQENTPCASGCGWSDATQTRCTACFPPTLKSRAKKGRR